MAKEATQAAAVQPDIIPKEVTELLEDFADGAPADLLKELPLMLLILFRELNCQMYHPFK